MVYVQRMNITLITLDSLTVIRLTEVSESDKILSARRRGQEAKARVCKTLIMGSNPIVASIFLTCKVYAVSPALPEKYMFTRNVQLQPDPIASTLDQRSLLAISSFRAALHK